LQGKAGDQEGGYPHGHTPASKFGGLSIGRGDE
jgi:hypothetical protein